MGNDPLNDPDRLAALRASGLLDSPPELAFDSLTKLATTALRVPVALVSLVDADRQFFKSQQGLPEPWATQRQTPLSHSFCQHVVHRGEPLLIADARLDATVCDNLAVRDLNVVAYAGVPLRDRDGRVLGSLCAIDGKERDWSPADVRLLEALAEQASAEIVLRQQFNELTQRYSAHQAADETRRALNRLDVHDLRTPLSAVVLGLDLIERIGSLDPRQSATVSLCKRNGRAMLAMIDSLLDINNVDLQGKAALRLQEIAADSLVAAAIEQAQPLASEKGMVITHAIDPALVKLCIDADKMGRVLVNLLANAVKFTPRGGKVHLSAVSSEQDGQAVARFEVRDNGIGVAEPERIFKEGVFLDRFAVTRRSTGLGLSFCKRIVEAHGGQIWLEQPKGPGSVFICTVPLVEHCHTPAVVATQLGII